jgi:hypothetical protein
MLEKRQAVYERKIAEETRKIKEYMAKNDRKRTLLLGRRGRVPVGSVSDRGGGSWLPGAMAALKTKKMYETSHGQIEQMKYNMQYQMEQSEAAVIQKELLVTMKTNSEAIKNARGKMYVGRGPPCAHHTALSHCGGGHTCTARWRTSKRCGTRSRSRRRSGKRLQIWCRSPWGAPSTMTYVCASSEPHLCCVAMGSRDGWRGHVHRTSWTLS